MAVQQGLGRPWLLKQNNILGSKNIVKRKLQGQSRRMNLQGQSRRMNRRKHSFANPFPNFRLRGGARGVAHHILPFTIFAAAAETAEDFSAIGLRLNLCA